MIRRACTLASLLTVLAVFVSAILTISGLTAPGLDPTFGNTLSGGTALAPLTSMGGGGDAMMPIIVSSERIDPDSEDSPGRTHKVFFPNTDHELHVFHIRGREPGSTMLIIGGMHGDEPGGYLAADLYADLSLRRGNLIVVPRANIQSIHRNTRGAGGDLNRRFGGYDDGQVDQEIAVVLEDLISDADVLLNLHDGSGFYSPEHVSSRRNPRLWGQSVIIDTEGFMGAEGARCELLSTAESAVARVNGLIIDSEHHFSVKNTLTFDEASPHLEQRGSATFFAVSEVGIPGFGVETSQDIELESLRVEYQVLVINAFLEEYGIIPDHPRFALETPALRYLAVSINGGPSMIIENGGSLNMAPGSLVEITHIEANYERGITVDFEGKGGFNDLGRTFRLETDTRIWVSKDKYPCGSVFLVADTSLTGVRNSPAVLPGEDSRISIEAFRISLNGRWTWLKPEETLRVLRGDELILDDPVASTAGGYKINFRGFVGNEESNDGEDRGYTVHTAHDLLQRFSLNPERERYEVRAELGGTIFARSFVEIVVPRLEYLLLQPGSGPVLALIEGDTINIEATSTLKVIDVVTMPRDSDPVTVEVRGPVGSSGRMDPGQTIQLGTDVLKDSGLPGRGGLYEFTVRRMGLQIGRVMVHLDGPGGGQR
ncbi:M99 family carboxypeptidase catalytic domain-containing protein [Candidatus Zixiibacteriota bacterium]